MIICDFHIVDIPVLPNKTNAQLPVDANTVLSLPVSAQGFQAIGRWSAEIIKALGMMQHDQLLTGALLNLLRQRTNCVAGKDSSRSFIPERLNHR